MKKINLILGSFFISTLVWGQKLSKEFEVISQGELGMEVYDPDPEAEAIVLFDIGKSAFFEANGAFDIRFSRSKRWKILKQEGTKYAEVEIPYYVDGYGRTEQVKDIVAHTYNFEDGQLIRKSLDPKDIFEEKINERWRAKKFVFPDVKPGSVIEYQYELETPFHFNLPGWKFQDKIPTIYSKYTVNIIPFYEYVFLAQGLSEFDHQSSEKSSSVRHFAGTEFHDLIHTYVKENIPAFKDEAYITSVNDYIMKLDFQLSHVTRTTGEKREIMSTWEKLNDDFNRHDNFGKYIKKGGKQAKKVLAELPVSKQAKTDPARAIIEYVKSNFSWNGKFGKMATKSPKDLLKEKSGNSADINLFMMAMLREAGIDAKPVILSTRGHGKIKADYPFEHFFNHVIVLVDEDHPYLADGVETLLPYNRIPLHCINDYGLVLIEKGEPGWINLEITPESLENTTIQMELDPEKLTAATTVFIQATEYVNYLYKKTFSDDEDKLRERFMETGFTSVGRISSRNFGKMGAPYLLGLEGTVPIERLGNKLLVTPFLEFSIQKNKLTQEERSYPVDFIYPRTENLTSSLQVPAGYRVLEIPEDYELDDELMTLRLQSNVLGPDKVAVKAVYALKKAVYHPNEYQKIKAHLDLAVKKLNEQIILEKEVF